MSVQFSYGYSEYKNKAVSDREISDLVGMDTYKALYTIFPDKYVDFTYPMKPTDYRLQEVNNIISLYDNLDGDTLKSYLVIYFFDWNKSPHSVVVKELINSSIPMLTPCVKDSTRAIWALIVLIITILIIYVIVFYVWPSLYSYRCTLYHAYGSPLEWLEKPWSD